VEGKFACVTKDLHEVMVLTIITIIITILETTISFVLVQPWLTSHFYHG
jgi:hypothetical protein